MYQGTWESVRTHRVPVWYDDAKLGIFIHWGLYSVPGWAPRVPDIQQLLIHDGPKRMLRESPYAEWYRNSMQIKGSPTQEYHARTYGEDYPYDNFVRTFDEASSGAEIARDRRPLPGRGRPLRRAHHQAPRWLRTLALPCPAPGQGRVSRPTRPGGRSRPRRCGPGACAWGSTTRAATTGPTTTPCSRRAADAVLAAPQGSRYVEYVTAHYHELIDRYRPSVLWNDIAWPRDPRLPELFAHYYNTVEDGVINDRWKEPGLSRNMVTDAAVRGAGAVLQALWPLIPERRKHLTFATPKHYDFRTPEYEVLRTVTARKWELAQGVGHSFGANRHEEPEDIITETDLIERFCDVVAKNGNLLIGVGPRPDGTIPELQQAPLRGLGAWLDVNAEAIYGSRPWVVAESATADGTPLRFTKSGEGVYALVMGMPRVRHITLPAIDGARVRRVRLVGGDVPLDFAVERGGDLSVTLPEQLPTAAVTVLDLGSDVVPRVGRTG